MKINEILLEIDKTNPAMQSEKWRANKEYETLIKFDPEFARVFLSRFQAIGETSVDAAYQFAALQMKKKAENEARATGRDSDQAGKDFISSIPDGGTGLKQSLMKKLEFERGSKNARGSNSNDANRTGRRGGQFGNKNAERPGLIQRGMSLAKDVWDNSRISTGYGFGRELGKSLIGGNKGVSVKK